MVKKGIIGLFFAMCTAAFTQSLQLPPDFRQHNLQEFNSNLFNPTYSLRQDYENQVALWSRWQWQGIDADPTTLYLSYMRSQERMSYGAGFIQHNTGLFQQTGGMLNFAYNLPLGGDFSLAFGVNVFGYQQELIDDRLDPGEPILPIDGEVDDFVFQVMPGIELQIREFAIGVTSENMLDYNFTESGAVTESDEKVFSVMARYSFPVMENKSGTMTTLEPLVYYRRVPGYDNQMGLTALWSAPSYWAQAGYNSFYGASLGAGVRLFEMVSIGALMEFGSNDNPVGGNTSYEVVMAFSFGPRKSDILQEEIEEELPEEDAALTDAEQAELEAEIEAQERAIAEAARRRDSLDAVARDQELALQRTRDSIAKAEEAALALNEEVVPEKGEKYQEVDEEGLEPGFYLITNVFGTKKYYEAFMKELADRGLEPKSFYRSANKFNYVYLQRYNSIQEARKARDSKFGGRYKDALWIFRIR
ncbi:PorP/SprF family type IX secretion system membrane protein [Robiginitalea aurantiaca]|uniref:PorP/SprF family type IX secretion system membrane protein n=1 Tax=Robiginitalea aurantiaca TaxID=3056915 RepID=A0ABT7WG83_9FLAO|nr:PorP/SprF family type IX secretion system membrane protein [Robiginitalea aurantiaca]MDM9631927.1 PorP/SprF family type IX secretion system membrane protein [Robiginitalea aurantiaca]